MSHAQPGFSRFAALLLVSAMCCRENTGPSAEPPTRIVGQAIASDGAPINGAVVTLTASAAVPTAVSSPVSADGHFELDVPASVSGTQMVDVIIDASSSRRVYRPLLLSGPLDSIRRRLGRPLLVPRTVNVLSPTFGNDTLAVSLFDAFDLPCTSFPNANCDSFFPQLWLSSVALWNESALPIALVFDRTTSVGSISPSDSVALWSVIDQMQRDLGRVVFRPGTLPPGARPDSSGYVTRSVAIRVDSTLIGVAGDTEWIWDADFNITAAKVRIPRAASFVNRGLMSHELLHTLGFNHTCAWSSVMGGYGCGAASGVTVGDAAAFVLAYQVRRAILASAPTTTLADARRGETQIEGVSTRSVSPGPNCMGTAPTSNGSLRAHPDPQMARQAAVLGLAPLLYSSRSR